MSHTELLLGQISKTIINCATGSAFQDLPIVCQDGTFLWSRLFLGACSNVVKDALSSLPTGDDPVIILPGLPVSMVKNTLLATILSTGQLTDEEIKVAQCLHFNSLTAGRNEDERGNVEEPSLKCQSCSLQFSRKLHFERHVAGHMKTTQFVCDQCGKIFYHEDNLKLHQRYHDDIKNIVPCPHCQTPLGGHRALRAHIDTLHAPRVPCPLCDRSFKKKILLRHIRSKHSEDPVDKMSLRKTLSKIRTKVLNSSEIRSSKVPQAKPTSNSTEASDAVQDLIDGQKKRVKCDSCDKTFANIYIAKSHSQRAHFQKLSEKTMSCSICEKKFGGTPSRLAR